MERISGILAIAVAACVVAVIGVKVSNHRRHLRELVHLVDGDDQTLIDDLEELVRSGELVAQ